MSFFKRNSAIIATFLIGVAVLILLHLYGNGNTGGVTYTIGGNFNPKTPDYCYTGASSYANWIPPNTFSEVQMNNVCKDICTSLGANCGWFNSTFSPDGFKGCDFYSGNITPGMCTDPAPPPMPTKTYVKN